MTTRNVGQTAAPVARRSTDVAVGFIPLAGHCHDEGVTEQEEPLSIQLSVVWPGIDELPVLASNHHLVQIEAGGTGTPEGIVVTLGYLAPPVLLGSTEEQQTSMRALGAVAVRSLIRVSMTRQRAAELIESLTTVIGQWDQKTTDGGATQ